jgi:hypothetical protein
MTISAAFITGLALLIGSASQEPQPAQRAVREVVSPSGDLDTLTLVMSSAGRAVVRFGPSEAGSRLIVLEPGDRIGRSAATVKEIAPDRLVLDELTRDKNGRPLRAQIVFRDGHTGGQRYMRDPGVDAPVAVRPEVLGPDGKAKIVKKPGRRP